MEILRQTLTPIDVLNIFKEQHRLCSPLDPEADPDIELTFESNMSDWSDANDLLPWNKLYPVLNKGFNISATEEEWKIVLTPYDKTLRGVCELIAKHSRQTDIESVKLLGQECLSSAVFLTLKKYLQRHGVNVENLMPSSLVEEYLDKYYGAMVEQTTIISNGKQVFTNLDVKRKKSGFLNYINIFDKDRYEFITGDIKTFRDLTMKIIDTNR
jgi:hypothetical protein